MVIFVGMNYCHYIVTNVRSDLLQSCIIDALRVTAEFTDTRKEAVERAGRMSSALITSLPCVYLVNKE